MKTGNCQRRARSATKLGIPVGGLSPQAMMEVGDPQVQGVLRCQAQKGVEQADGIGPAGNRRQHPITGLKEALGVDGVADLLQRSFG